MLIFLGTAALVGSLGYAFYLPYFQIQQIEIRSAEIIPAAEVESAIRREITGQEWLILPRDNFFLVSSDRLERAVREQFSSVETVSVGRHFPNRLTVEVRERMLWGLYCRRENLASPPDSCLYLDTHGIAYEDVSDIQGWLLPVVYAPEAKVLGEEVASPAAIEFYEGAKRSLRGVGAEMLWVSFSTSSPVEARLGLAEGWSILVTASRPVEEWTRVLAVVLEKEISNRRSELEYVDLRFGNKVFFKYK
ncbi:MAG: FtsQ-type POTRA domain-containing protein [Candidatus Sungbacteria bacterium]|uniref:FtsQ-type POTRA domain-containing protein n=1 Tax=Candidatus Sungiibacteriota bacterium TaxID=2750080 RepID=A0A933DTQ2_9BACT|nr:FtsQ-type POTRA domain-containing protein [Candidatus Sungbacteria bacterium]